MDAFLGTILSVGFNFPPQGWVSANGQTLPVAQYNALFALFGTLYGGDGRTNFGIPDLRGRVPIGGQAQGAGLLNYPIGTKGGQEATALPAHAHTAAFTPATGPQSVTIPATTGTLSVTSTPSLTATGTANLAATTSGTVKLGTASTGGVTPAAGMVLGKGGAQASIYATATPATDFALGGTQTFTGTATGTVNSAVTGAITNVVSGNASTPAQTVSITTVNGGAVTVNSYGVDASYLNLQPYLAINFIVCVQGIYPPRN